MKMNKRSQYIVLSGIGLLAVALLVLLVSTSMVFSPTVTVIGSNLNKSTTDQVTVTTKADFSGEDQMKAFPLDIGTWHGAEYDTTATAKTLNAPVLLMRSYIPETLSQPLYLVVVQSKTNSSFHPPDYCYKAQGYQIQENAVEYLTVTDKSWTTGPNSITLPMNKLVATKAGSSGVTYERRLVLSFYVKGNQYYSDEITMVQVQALVPLKGSYDGTLTQAKGFMTEFFPMMFQPGSSVESKAVITTLAEKGAIGYAGIGFILLVPVAVIAYPFLRRKDKTL